MITAFHGSNCLFDRFDLSKAGEGTGVKFGFGVYLTEAEKSAVHYSQPRKAALSPEHYLYTVEIPDLTEDNHLVSAQPVAKAIIEKVETKLGQKVPEQAAAQGKKFRNWVGMTLLGEKKNTFECEKAAAKFLNNIGIVV